MKPLQKAETEKFSYTLSLSEDKMKLFLAAKPKAGVQLTIDDLIEALTKHASLERLDRAVLADTVELLNQGQEAKERRIAKGSQPTEGSDGKVVLLVKPFTGKGKQVLDEKGGSKFHDLQLFDNLRIGQEILRLYAPVSGVPGEDVLGKPIKPKAVKSAKVLVDSATIDVHTPPSGVYQSYVAREEGCLIEQNGKFSITSSITIKGDIDLHYGDINFIGHITIDGNVRPGFVVKGNKGITVTGSVEGGTLLAPAGPVVVKGFAYGGRGKIVAGEKVNLSHCRDVDVEAHSDIEVVKEVMTSRFTTRENVRCKSARILGGELRSGGTVEALAIGNSASIRTSITFCSPEEADKEFMGAEEELRNHEKAISLIKLHLGPFAGNTKALEKLSDEHRKKIQELLKKLSELQASKLKLLQKRDAISAQSTQVTNGGVVFYDSFFPGTSVSFQDISFGTEVVIHGPKKIFFDSENRAFTVTQIETGSHSGKR